jgi:histidinol-phosphate aminotransferase
MTPPRFGDAAAPTPGGTGPPAHGHTDTGPPAHGGTDGGPPARFDFSSNANALGPAPALLDLLRAVDPTDYPDPAYTQVRDVLAAWHARDPGEVVVGAGACELIHRAVRTAGGPVVVREPTFGEYRYAAEVAGVPLRRAHDAATFERMLPGAALAVLCLPNSPDGRIDDVDRAAAAATAAGCRLLLDLAYHPLSQVRPPPPSGTWQLWAPNKAHGLTGIRAAYLVAPADDAARLSRAPSWVLSAHGAAFLTALPTPAARQWVVETRETLWGWRDRLVERLGAAGVAVTAGTANFVLAHVTDAAATTAELRRAGIRVRDATSFGLPHAVRLSAQPPRAQDALITELARAHRDLPRPRHRRAFR